MLRNEQANKEKIINKNTIIDNLNKILKLNDYQNTDSKNINKGIKVYSITQNVEENNDTNIDKNNENNRNYSNESNHKNSKIIDMVLKSHNESNIKNVKFGNKRKSTELLNGNTFLNFQDLMNINNITENKINNDKFNQLRDKNINSEKKENNKFYFNFHKNYKFDATKENKCPNTDLKNSENTNNENLDFRNWNEYKNNFDNNYQKLELKNKKGINDNFQFNSKNTKFFSMGEKNNSYNKVDDLEFVDEEIKFAKNRENENYKMDKYNLENVSAMVLNNEIIENKYDLNVDDMMDIVNPKKS